jgi:hypothetical protein
MKKALPVNFPGSASYRINRNIPVLQPDYNTPEPGGQI